MSKTFARNAFLDDEDVWNQVLSDAPETFNGRPALFLDRDGALIEEKHYLSDPAGVVLEKGAAEVVRTCNAANIAVVVVTNQAGIARDYYDWDAFEAVQNKMLADLDALGTHIDAVYACGHHKDGVHPYRHDDHPARKPNPGMLTRATKDLGIDPARSWIIGDRGADLAAGRNAGLQGGMHVLTGHGADDGELDKAKALANDTYTVITADGIWNALEKLPLFID